MKEQNEKEQEKSKTKRKRIGGEKRFYLITAIGCAVALVAIITVAIVVSNGTTRGSGAIDSTPTVSAPDSSDNGNDEGNNEGDGEQVVVTPEGMVMPLQTVSILHDHGFYHNTTLNCYYEHAGVDFSAEAGTEVIAAESGTIESVYKDDILLGTEIVVDHGDGVKTLYRFVTEKTGLKAGDKVEKGDVIATVAEANGNEYKDGAHLHFEVIKNGQSVDPAAYLTLEEK